jgi:alkanesulfonate monooxygenase SsuD/methylene tetrahydromethanopterin reductase-like flavin-dependent oxidoreductase (luciferase family)
MRAGLLLTFQNIHENLTDEDVFHLEMGLAESAEDLGFDTVWAVEHHFDDYAMCPDNFVTLANLAAKTSTIKLATGAVILPWNTPLRVAEKVVMLDYMTNGRLVLGLGRGLARMEYEGFGIPMAEARERFDESAAMILSALESGKMEGTGEFYPQAPVTLRPAPTRGFRDRVYAVAMSPDSVKAAARLGASMMAFIQAPMETHAEAVALHREEFIKTHGRNPDIPVLAQQMFCHADGDVAKEMAYKYLGQYLHTVVKHYEFGGEHFKTIKGYQSYEEGAKAIRDAGVDAAVEGLLNFQLWGTPDQILEKLRSTRELCGDFESCVVAAYGQMSPEITKASFELFGREVVPGLHEMAKRPLGHEAHTAPEPDPGPIPAV